MRIRSCLAAAACAVSLWAQSNPYVGAEACGRCHPAELRRQSSSEHAHALSPASRHPLAARFATRKPLRRSPAFDFRFVLEGRGLLVRVATADRAIVVPVDWAFGAGDQAVTFVSRVAASQYREFYFTYFSALGGMGITPGQEGIQTGDLAEAAGFVHRDLDAVQCFQCHSTGPVDISAGVFQPHEIGVRCEACHGPGGEHAATGGKAGIRNPRRLGGAAINDLCGKCHRLPPAEGAAYDWNNPWNVRFEPAYLSRSSCFRKSKDRLSCLTCHPAHDALQRDSSHYNAVCIECHSTAHRDRQAMNDCVNCHMPKVSPRRPLEFANHWIGIYGNGGITPEQPAGGAAQTRPKPAAK